MIWSLKNLEKFLTENGVDISKWGTGEAKTVQHLLKELIKKECEINVVDGKVVRKVSALSINVLYKNEVLKEEYQRFKDGRIRRRRMDCSVAEKITEDEVSDINTAAKRAIKEELQISISDNQIGEILHMERTRASGSYPDTIMDMVLYKCDVILEYNQYHPYGYIEHQEDKDTFFIWVDRTTLKKHGWVRESKLTKNN